MRYSTLSVNEQLRWKKVKAAKYTKTVAVFME
jgi:hypothetical protein